MYLFRRLIALVPKRFYSNACQNIVVEHLKSRSLIRVAGNDVEDFLQGLITNDIKHLATSPGSMYTMFLNTKGRVLYDAIIYRAEEEKSYFIECDKEAMQPLQKHLRMYRVRRKIDIDSLEDSFNIYALFENARTNQIGDTEKLINEGIIVPCSKLEETLPVSSNVKTYKDLFIFKDPRVVLLGSRVLAKKEIAAKEQIKDIISDVKQVENVYREFRYSLGIAEGVEDLPPGNGFPLECNCDYLHGVSFHKGCYIGQELTARTHHTGVIRKRLMPLFFLNLPTNLPKDGVILHENVNLGKIRGIGENVALGLIRIEKALEAGQFKVGNGLARVVRPNWWPIEVAKDKISVQKL